MHAAMPVSCGGTIWAPSPRYTLYPLSAGGLCDAVTTTPAAESVWVIDQASTGVGTCWSNNRTRMPMFAQTRAESSANTSLLRRAS